MPQLLILYLLGAGGIIFLVKKGKEQAAKKGITESYNLDQPVTPLYAQQVKPTSFSKDGEGNNEYNNFSDVTPHGPMTEAQKSFWEFIGKGVDLFTGGIITATKEVTVLVKDVFTKDENRSSYNGSDNGESEDRGGDYSSGFGSGGDDPDEEDRGGYF